MCRHQTMFSLPVEAFEDDYEDAPVSNVILEPNKPIRLIIGAPSSSSLKAIESVPDHPLTKRKCKAGKKSSRDLPKRPLSAYNLFFQHERQLLLERLPVRAEGKPKRSHGKIGFKDMVRIIGAKWKTIDQQTKFYYEENAAKEKARYNRELNVIKERRVREACRRVDTSLIRSKNLTKAYTPNSLIPLPSLVLQSNDEVPLVNHQDVHFSRTVPDSGWMAEARRFATGNHNSLPSLANQSSDEVPLVNYQDMRFPRTVLSPEWMPGARGFNTGNHNSFPSLAIQSKDEVPLVNNQDMRFTTTALRSEWMAEARRFASGNRNNRSINEERAPESLVSAFDDDLVSCHGIQVSSTHQEPCYDNCSSNQEAGNRFYEHQQCFTENYQKYKNEFESLGQMQHQCARCDFEDTEDWLHSSIEPIALEEGSGTIETLSKVLDEDFLYHF